MRKEKRQVIPENLILALRNPFLCEAKLVGQFSRPKHEGERRAHVLIKQNAIAKVVDEEETSTEGAILTQQFPTEKAIRLAARRLRDKIVHDFPVFTKFNSGAAYKLMADIGNGYAIEGTVDLIAVLPDGSEQDIFIEIVIGKGFPPNEAEEHQRMALRELIGPSEMRPIARVFSLRSIEGISSVSIEKKDALLPQRGQALLALLPRARLLAHSIQTGISPISNNLIPKTPGKGRCRNCYYRPSCPSAQLRNNRRFFS